MRIPPLAAIHRSNAAKKRPSPFIDDLRLSATIIRMISTNALAAFTQQVSRSAGMGVQPVRGPDAPAGRVGPISPIGGGNGGAGASAAGQQRSLDALPPPPSQPLPRGSLLDLRV